MTTAWTRGHLATLSRRPLPALPVFGPGDCVTIRSHAGSGQQWMWDFWPAECPSGQRVRVGGGELWFALAAPAIGAPDARHAVARIHTIHRVGDLWHDLGPAFRDGFTPGSREWSGSAIVEHGRIALYFTAAGRRGEPHPTLEQRIFECHAAIDPSTGTISDWSAPAQCFESDGAVYAAAREQAGAIGTMEAFRDPAWFRDPADGREYILFTGTVAASRSAHRGCIGIARRSAEGWALLAPLVTADGVNNELERPHLRVAGGAYHLYWSTQAHVFADRAWQAPTGLYAMTSDNVLGPYAPVAGSGLVACNPPTAPRQAYSWWVCGDGQTYAFADQLATTGAPQFTGKLAPRFDLAQHRPGLSYI